MHPTKPGSACAATEEIIKSKAAIGDHPIHPALVPLPIGCFFLALVSDVLHALTRNAFWYDVSAFAIGVGIATALAAAVFGFIDFIAVEMSPAGWRIAKIHLALNLTAVVLYVASFWIRRDHRALGNDAWMPAFVLQLVGFMILGTSGWLGGKLSFEHKVGVVETADPEATKLGLKREGATGGQRAAS